MGTSDGNKDTGKNGKGNDRKSEEIFNKDELNDLYKVVFGVTEADLDFAGVLYKIREKNPGWEREARTLLANRLRELLGLYDLVESVNSVRQDLQNYQLALQVKIAQLLPEGDLRKRFEAEFPEEKKQIAEFVSQNYFSSMQMCFIQASTFMLHLAESMLQMGNGRGSVIHTNSTVFPWLMLVKNSKYSIYATCGQEHDPLCCGWLFSRSDDDARDHIESLFRRPKAALDTAFVTPQHITTDGKLHFALEGTSELVDTLASNAPRLVILSPLQRLRNNPAELDSSSHSWNEVDLFETRRLVPKSKTEFVFAGDTSHGFERENLQNLEELGPVNVLEETA